MKQRPNHNPLIITTAALMAWGLIGLAICSMIGCQPSVRIDPAKSEVSSTRDETRPKTTTTTTTTITIRPKGAP